MYIILDYGLDIVNVEILLNALYEQANYAPCYLDYQKDINKLFRKGNTRIIHQKLSGDSIINIEEKEKVSQIASSIKKIAGEEVFVNAFFDRLLPREAPKDSIKVVNNLPFSDIELFKSSTEERVIYVGEKKVKEFDDESTFIFSKKDTDSYVEAERIADLICNPKEIQLDQVKPGIGFPVEPIGMYSEQVYYTIPGEQDMPNIAA